MGWFALTVQLYLILANGRRVLRDHYTYFRFILFLQISCTVVSHFFLPLSPWKFFLHNLLRRCSIITVFGLVYISPSSIWEPTDATRVDEFLHTIIPVLFIFYWLVSKSAAALKWRNAFPWLVYPLVYLLFILLRGKTSGYYPYPFVDVISLGYSRVFVNCFYLFFCFLVISLAFIAIPGAFKRN